MTLLAAALLVTGLAAEPGRHRLAGVDLAGPLESVRLVVEPLGETRVRGPLLAGERRSIVVPLPVGGDVEGLVPEVLVEGAGSATFTGWDAANAVADAAWAELPGSLRRRPRAPAPVPTAPALPSSALFVAAAAALATWAVRKRGLAAVGVAAVGAGLGWALVGEAPAPRGLRVLEVEAGAWLVVDSAVERLVAPPGERTVRVEVRPPRTRLVYEVDLAGPPGAWTLFGPGCRLHRLDVLEAPPTLGPERNGLADLERTWVRAADGSGWRDLGAWPRGSALPQDGAGGEPADPPGDLNPALPLGRRVLVGRLAPEGLGGGPALGTAGGAPGGDASKSTVWVRLVGLE